MKVNNGICWMFCSMLFVDGLIMKKKWWL